MRIDFPDRFDLREILFTDRHLAGLLDPVLAEDTLQGGDQRTFHANRSVTPVVAVLPVAAPLFGDAVPADVSNASVDHGDLPMRSQVHATDVADLQRPEAADMASRIIHFGA